VLGKRAAAATKPLATSGASRADKGGVLMTHIRSCTTLRTLQQERRVARQPSASPLRFGQEDNAVVAAPPAALAQADETQRSAPHLHRPSPAQQAQALEELPRQLEGTQRFMQYYVTSAPHARAAAPLLPKMNWAPTDVAAYTGMEWDSVIARSNGVDSVMLVNMVMDGFVGVCADVNHRLENGECFFGPFGAFWSSLGVIGFETGYNDVQRCAGARFNGNINLSASDHIFLGSRLVGGDVHTDDGFEAARIRSHLSLTPDAPAFRAEVSSTRAKGVCGAWGLSAWTWLRALCRIDYTSAYDISYSTWTSGIAGRLLSMDGMNVFNQWLHNMWQTVWTGPKIAIPPVSDPECMAPGDTLRATFNHRHGKLFTAGTFWAYAGRHYANVDQTKVLLTREVGAKPKHEGTSTPLLAAANPQDEPAVLAIKISAQKVRSRRWFTVISGGAGVDTGKHLPDETTFTLKATLNAENLLAYKQMMQAIRQAQTVEQHRQAVQAFARVAGTSYHEEKVTGRITSSELGVRVGLFPMNLWGDWVPQGFSWGLGNHTQTSHMTRSGPQQASYDYFLNQTQKLRGPDGDRTTDAVAVVRRAAPDTKASGGGVILSTRIRLSRADGDEATRLLIAPLNQMYGAQLAPLTGAGWRVSRDVSLEQCLTPAEMVALSQLSEASLVAAARSAQCPAEPLRRFVAALQAPAEMQHAADCDTDAIHAATLERCIAALSPFLTAAGAHGVAAIYRALAEMSDEPQSGEKQEAATPPQGAPKLIVRSHSEAYERPRALLNTLYLRYHDAALTQRKAMQQAVTEAQNEILVTANLLRQDSFLDVNQKDAWLAEFSECSKQLTRLYFQPAHKPASANLSQFALALQNFSAKHNVASGLSSFAAGDAVHAELKALREGLNDLLAQAQVSPETISEDNVAMVHEAQRKITTWEQLVR
jgi:hypothetical protein